MISGKKTTKSRQWKRIIENERRKFTDKWRPQTIHGAPNYGIEIEGNSEGFV